MDVNGLYEQAKNIWEVQRKHVQPACRLHNFPVAHRTPHRMLASLSFRTHVDSFVMLHIVPPLGPYLVTLQPYFLVPFFVLFSWVNLGGVPQ